MDRAARRLRTGQTQVIAFLMHREDPSDKFLRQLLLGLTDRLLFDGYHLIIIPEQEISELGSIEYLNRSRTCDGVILTHTKQFDVRVQWLTAQQVPFITHGQTAHSISHAFVDYDHQDFLTGACKVLSDDGASRIAVLLPPSDRFDTQLMTKKIKLIDEITTDASVTAVDNFPPDMKALDLAAWAIGTGKDFDGFVCYTDNFVNGLMMGFSESHRRIGEDIHIATRVHGLNSSHLSENVRSFHQDLYEDGRLLAEGIVSQLKSPSNETIKVLSKPKTYFHEEKISI